MQLTRLTVASATAAAITLGGLTAPVATAQEAPEGGSAMWLYRTSSEGVLDMLQARRGGRHTNETFYQEMAVIVPMQILLFPLQMIAEAEVRLSSYPRM